MQEELKPAIKSIKKVAGWLWDRGWAEWGAGNLSINVTGLISDSALSQPGRLQKLSVSKLNIPYIQNISEIASLNLLISLSGSRMRQIMKNPEQGLCLLHFDHEEQPVIFPLTKLSITPVPTSESASHLLIHQILSEHRPEHKAVLHTHPAEIIALSQVKELRNQEFLNKTLNTILPELSIYLPEGIAFVPYHLSGSTELATSSAEAMKDHRVAIWEKHGIIATGSTLEEAFDAIDLVNKAARIWFFLNHS